jgi:hypothetical protein
MQLMGPERKENTIFSFLRLDTSGVHF